jgi:hypothetical protein
VPTLNTLLPGLQELVSRAQAGDRSVLPELRAFLDDNPSVWSQTDDLAVQAQELWLQLLAGKDLLLEESVRRKLEELRVELAGCSPSPLEQLLVQRVLACWVQSYYADALYAQARGPDATAAVRQELIKRQESAQRRYLASVKQLAIVRKLLKPSVSPLDLIRPVEEGTPNRGRPLKVRAACAPVGRG